MSSLSRQKKACVYVYVCIYIYTHVYTIYIYIYMYIYIYIFLFIYTCPQIVRTCVFVCVCVDEIQYMWNYLIWSAYLHVCVRALLFV